MRKIKRFIKDRKGAVFMIIALCFVSMVGITATALDYSRGSLLKSELVAALDSAALAGGTVANSSTLNATVTKYFNVNMPAGYIGSTIDTPVITQPPDKSTLTVATAAHLKDAMLQVVGWNMTNIAASSQVTIEKKGMELVLVLDNTGSMGTANSAGNGQSKLTALKAAATTLVNILYGSKTTVDNLWIGLVPFSQGVNIGPSRSSFTSASASYNPTTWSGCVEAREASNRDVTDDPPSVALFPKYYASCFAMTSANNWSGLGSPTWWNAWYGNNTSTSGGQPPIYTNCSTTGSWNYISNISSSYGPNQYCPQEMTPMTATKTTIINGINSMQAVGDTEIDLGLGWGWRLLSPRWRYSSGTTSLWGGDMDFSSGTNNSPTKAALPLDYNTPLMSKVVVLLTDGDNSFVPYNYTAYGKLSDGRLGTTNQNTAVTTINNRTKQLCDSMKASDKGIIIYTVALGTSISSTGQALLQYCASKPEYYFYSPTGSDLQTAFTTIGDSLSNLRISQ